MYAGTHIDCVKELLKHGAIVGATTNIGVAAIHHAAAWGHHNIISLLMKEDESKLNMTDYFGLTPIAYACMFGQSKCVDMLLQNGAGFEIKDKFGFTPLMFACMDRLNRLLILQDNIPRNKDMSHGECIRLLLSKGASVNTRNQNGSTALHIAVDFSILECVKDLASQPNIDLSLTNFENHTAIDLARINGFYLLCGCVGK